MRIAYWLAVVAAAAATSDAASLKPRRFEPLPLGSVKPRGWLRAELQAMANGLAGHEFDFYAYVSDSPWLHKDGRGAEYAALNEAFPYWFNGLVPLAYALNDERLKAQVHSAAATVLGLQQDDGWIGPEKMVQRNFWSRTPFFLGLIQLVEANATWEKPVLKGLRKFWPLANSMLKRDGLGYTWMKPGGDADLTWGQIRSHDTLLVIQWLLDNYPSDSQDGLLWETMNLLHRMNKFKWDAWYNEATYQKIIKHPDAGQPTFPFTHGVNVGQGFKASAVVWRFNHNESLLDTTRTAINWTYTYHGAPSGSILADEIQRDTAPYMGSELCMAVETGYSFAYLYQALGDNSFADRGERVIFNALPVSLTEDGWAHQYMAQPNQPWTNFTGRVAGKRKVFTTADFGVATRFGMEPQFPCCTVNYPQGWPKFLSNSWATIGNSGLVHALLSPSMVTTTLNAHKVTVEVTTGYPFTYDLHYDIDADAPFDLYIRVPTWSEPKQTVMTLSGKQISMSPDPETGLQKVRISAGTSQLRYNPHAKMYTEARENDAVSVYVGNILYSLDVGNASTYSGAHAFLDREPDADNVGVANLPYPIRDWFFWNTSAWNIAIDPSTLRFHPLAPNTTLSLGTQSGFSGAVDTGYVSVRGCEIEWGLFEGYTPNRVPDLKQRKCLGPARYFDLVPYGKAKAHMSELPTLNLRSMGMVEEDDSGQMRLGQ